jgi:hypothetical protein
MLAGDPVSSRDEAEGVFDPTQQARLVFYSERLHQGLASEAIVEALLQNSSADITSLPLADADRSILADILLEEDGAELDPDLVEQAILALRQKKQLRVREQELKLRIAEAERRHDSEELVRLMKEKLELDRAMAAGR